MTAQNPFVYTENPELHQMFEQMNKLQARVAEKFKQAERMAGFSDNTGFKKLEDVKVELPALDRLRNPGQYTRWGGNIVALDRVEAQARQAIAIARAEVARVEALNKPNIEANSMLVTQIKDFMSRLGFNETYTTYEFPSNRSRTRKEYRHQAGYLSDIQRLLPHSNTTSVAHQINDYENRLKDFLRFEREKEQKEKTESDAKVMASIVNDKAEIVQYLIRKGINVIELLNQAESGRKSMVIYDVLRELRDQVLSQDKYLRLAYAMECCRNDFSEGPDVVQSALDCFEVETDDDQQAYMAIRDRIYGWEGDGRVFRDMNYGYDYMYGEVKDQSLCCELRTINEYLENL